MLVAQSFLPLPARRAVSVVGASQRTARVASRSPNRQLRRFNWDGRFGGEQGVNGTVSALSPTGELFVGGRFTRLSLPGGVYAAHQSITATANAVRLMFR